MMGLIFFLLASMYVMLGRNSLTMVGMTMVGASSSSSSSSSSTTTATDYEVLSTIQHDAKCFTQGLLYHRGYIYESCGLNGKSSIRKVDPDTGVVLQETTIPKEYFAEGLVAVDSKLYMLTWQSKIMFVVDVDTLNLLGRLRYTTHNGEGWGLTYDAKENRLVVSDGTSYLTFFAVPDHHQEHTELVKQGEVNVKDGGRAVTRINELEMSPDGQHAYANLWYLDEIVKIHLGTGAVTERLQMAHLYPPAERVQGADCLNGIAYNATDETFLLTGKLWPKVPF